MWVQVQVRVDAIAPQKLLKAGPDNVYTTDGTPGLEMQAWVQSEKLPPLPDGETNDYKCATLVVWLGPTATQGVTLFGAWSHAPGQLIADKWEEGVAT